MESLHFVYLPRAADVLSMDEWHMVELALLENPHAGVVIPGTGGVRKLRASAMGRGKRGGVRVIYLYIADDGWVYCLLAYRKNVQADMTPAQKAVVRALVGELRKETR